MKGTKKSLDSTEAFGVTEALQAFLRSKYGKYEKIMEYGWRYKDE